jgi:transposase
MTKPLSSDLRERLIEAVAAGMSRRAAADRFGIAASTAVKWVRRWRDTGSNASRPQGGDKRSDRIEAHAKEILGLVAATHDITLSEIASHLERRHGERFAQSTVWRLLDRHAMTFKKKRCTPASRSARTWPRKDKPGAPRRQSLIRNVLSSSMRPARRPR